MLPPPFSYLMALTRTSSAMLSKSCESRYPSFYLILESIVFIYEYNVSSRYFVDSLYQFEEISFCPFSEHLKLSWGVVYTCANIIYIYTHTHRPVKKHTYIYILITSNNFVHNVRGIEDYCNQSILILLKQGVVKMPL